MAHSRFDRPMGQRRALLRGLVTSFLETERIKTTLTKAKEAQSISEKMITLGKLDTLAARRQAMSYITKEDVVKKLFDTIAPRYAHRSGGYTRILDISDRLGDGAPMAILELVAPEK
ncbi:MAG: 50S ribosomal protein L17 [Bacillota bacterium]